MKNLSEKIVRALQSDLTIDISTTGRKSGKLRRIEIWFMYVHDRVYITGTPGKRDWFANLLKTPHFIFHLKESLNADLPARARPIRDLEERRNILTNERMAWYHHNSESVEAFIRDAPLVEVIFS